MNSRIKRAFTVAETTIVMVIIGAIAVTLLYSMKPNNVERDLLDKNAKKMLFQIEYATKQILAKNTDNFTFTKLFLFDGTNFSITDYGADANLLSLYRKYLVGLRNYNPDNAYLSTFLRDEAGNNLGYELSKFEHYFKMKNGAHIAIRLHEACDVDETKIYHPQYPDKREQSNSCGLIFFDINAKDSPNILGIDQFIVALGKYGIK